VAASDAELAMASAEQLEHGAQPVLLLERNHPELHRGGELAGLNLDWAIEPRAQGRVDAEQPEIEQPPHQLERGLDSTEAVANETLLFCRQRDLGRSRRTLDPEACCRSAGTKLDDG
jgi:hypothetical protein